MAQIALKFIPWFEAKYGHGYPGKEGELAYIVHRRIAEAVAEYIDEILTQALKDK